MPLSAAVSDDHRLLREPLHDAAMALAERGVLGVVWLDADLNIVRVAGTVPPSVKPGIPAMLALVPLIGLDDELKALKHCKLPQIRIPNTAVVANNGEPSARMNLTVFWYPNRQHYLLMMGAILSEASATTELDQEIRRRRLIEQDLAARSREFERINQQLEQFAYVISHDLNAPLRALRYLSRDIQNELGLGDPDDNLPNLAPDLGAVGEAAGAIAVQTRRMSKMLTDLLEYARIGRIKDSVTSVDTQALIGDIVTSMTPTTSLTLSVSGDWPILDTAAAPLDLVLRNLVENAVKHHDLAQGHVDIRAELQRRYVLFHVSDDGRGIAPEWQAAIFEPFRKIDDAHHPESSGIGLALVKKTVTMLGGGIEVQSAAPESRGTTFIVRWPLKLADVETATRE